MNIYAKLTLLCVVLVVITSSIVYFLVNMELEQAFGAEAIQAMANDSGTIATTVQSTIDRNSIKAYLDHPGRYCRINSSGFGSGQYVRKTNIDDHQSR